MTKRRIVRSCDDKMYHVGGKTYPHLVGSRRQVFEGFAYKTAGELSKSDLMRNKHGRYVSRRKHISATKEKRLLKAGYTARKGRFGAVKIDDKKKKTKGGDGDGDEPSSSSA